jgi:hypothetical protein
VGQPVLPRILVELGVEVNIDDWEVLVKVPRFRIGSIMFFIALAALDFGAIRAVFDHKSRTGYLLGIGAVPMANVLAVGLLIGHRRRRSRRFLSGFVVLGAMAVAVYVAVASVFAEELVIPYIMYNYNHVFGYKGLLRSLQPYVVIYYPILALMLGLPQLAFALVGGLLSHAYGNRRAAGPSRC